MYYLNIFILDVVNAIIWTLESFFDPLKKWLK